MVNCFVFSVYKLLLDKEMDDVGNYLVLICRFQDGNLVFTLHDS